jgi:hypothetical protein
MERSEIRENSIKWRNRSRIALRSIRATEFYPRFGQAAATASASQLAISSVPPVRRGHREQAMPGIVPQRQVAGEQACRNDEAESRRDADSLMHNPCTRQARRRPIPRWHETAASTRRTPAATHPRHGRSCRQHDAVGAHDGGKNDQDAAGAAHQARSRNRRTIAARSSGHAGAGARGRHQHFRKRRRVLGKRGGGFAMFFSSSAAFTWSALVSTT